jgi:hypothetical protein
MKRGHLWAMPGGSEDYLTECFRSAYIQPGKTTDGMLSLLLTGSAQTSSLALNSLAHWPSYSEAEWVVYGPEFHMEHEGNVSRHRR